jgi:hypothetical protein
VNAERILKILIWIGIIVLIAHWCVLSYVNGTKATQREAVALGHAEFVADKEGNVEFKWKEIK